MDITFDHDTLLLGTIQITTKTHLQRTAWSFIMPHQYHNTLILGLYVINGEHNTKHTFKCTFVNIGIVWVPSMNSTVTKILCILIASSNPLNFSLVMHDLIQKRVKK